MKTHSLRLAVPLALAAALAAAGAPRAAEPRVIEITARRFEFQPAQITIKQGEPVVLRVKSLDVTHGFYQKALGIDATIAPGKPTDVPVTAKAPGRYVTICDHFCGSGHGNMKMTIVVE
jgi:cytochrome c oxidase subunit 2